VASVISNRINIDHEVGAHGVVIQRDQTGVAQLQPIAARLFDDQTDILQSVAIGVVIGAHTGLLSGQFCRRCASHPPSFLTDAAAALKRPAALSSGGHRHQEYACQRQQDGQRHPAGRQQHQECHHHEKQPGKITPAVGFRHMHHFSG
jgi:hypothetical protein